MYLEQHNKRNWESGPQTYPEETYVRKDPSCREYADPHLTNMERTKWQGDGADYLLHPQM